VFSPPARGGVRPKGAGWWRVFPLLPEEGCPEGAGGWELRSSQARSPAKADGEPDGMPCSWMWSGKQIYTPHLSASTMDEQSGDQAPGSCKPFTARA
jgi:hypothetical protein